MTTAGDQIGKARLVLIDSEAARWTNAELLGWLNRGMGVIAALRADAASVIEAVALAAGCKQAMPNDSTRLLDIPRNLGADGNTPGPSIRLVEMEDMSAWSPNWNADTPASTVKHFMYDERVPLDYYVWPPVQPPCYVEMVRGTFPAECLDLASTIPLWQAYHEPLLDYMLYWAFSKDAELGQLNDKAQFHRGKFDAFFGEKGAADLAGSPNTALEGGLVAKSARRG